MHFFRALTLYINFLFDCIFIIAYFLFSLCVCFVKLFIPCRKKKSLKNEIVLVTGGNNGIGREILLRLGQTDPDVTLICWGRDEARNKQMISDLKAIGVSKAYAFNVDVTNVDQVAQAAEQVRDQIGDVTMLINNAGIVGKVAPMWDLTAADAKKLYDVNWFSHFTTINEFVPAMLKRGRGHIVANCSITGFLYGPKGTVYASCKHAMTAGMHCLKEDLRVQGVRDKVKLTIVYPSITETNLFDGGLNIQPRKYPFILQFLKAPDVARRIVDGVLANEEYVYIPSWFKLLHMFLPLIPTLVVSKALSLMKLDPDLPFEF